MPTDRDRRYDDREVAEILERAADAEIAARPEPHPADGLTLADLQKIGAEAGLDADLIARAAAAIDARPVPTRRMRLAGLPIGVARTVPLPRPLAQDEWERMVASFRSTFHARGRVRSDGDLHEWSNGNLQALIEPAADGWSLRFSTRKSDASTMVAVGSLMILGAVLMTILSVLGISGDGDAGTAVLLALAGAAQLGWSAVRLPSWADERERQFEALGEEALRITGGPAR